MTDQNDILEDIENCKDLFVVLTNRFEKPYVESYQLSSIMTYEDKFWCKFRNVHTWWNSKHPYKASTLSYLYNNYCPVVFSIGIDNCIARLYSTYAYASIKYISKNVYQRVWSSDDKKGPISTLKDFQNSTDLKVKLFDEDGHTLILPIQSLSFSNHDFLIETEYDAFPIAVKDHQTMIDLGKELDGHIEKETFPTYPCTDFSSNIDFSSTHFKISKNKIICESLLPKREENDFNIIKYEIWAES